jgi:hypothetical protein
MDEEFDGKMNEMDAEISVRHMTEKNWFDKGFFTGCHTQAAADRVVVDDWTNSIDNISVLQASTLIVKLSLAEIKE